MPQPRVTLALLLIGVAGACSIRLRQLLWGIPVALTIAGPSTPHALIESRSVSFHDAAMDAERIPLTSS